MGTQETEGARRPPEHAQINDEILWAMLPAVALDAADREEAALVYRNLAGRAGAAEELAAYARLVEVMHFSAAPAAPPPALEQRLRIALTAPTVATVAADTAPVGAKTDAAQPVDSVRSADSVQPARGRAWLWPALGWSAAAAALLFFVLNLQSANQIGVLTEENAALRYQTVSQQAQLADQEVRLVAQQQVLDEQAQVLSTLQLQEASLERTVAGQVDLLAELAATLGESYEMPPAQENSSALATVSWLDRAGVGVLRADNFPVLPPDQVYQLWLIKDGGRTSGGLFTVDENGRGSLVFTPPGSLDDFDGMGVTPEPAGGSDGPTAPPVVLAMLHEG